MITQEEFITLQELNDNAFKAELKKHGITNFSATLTLQEFLKDSNNKFISFFDKEKRISKNSDDLIVKIYDENGRKLADTGNFIGSFKIDKYDAKIASRFSNVFLQRMLNFANDIYINDATIKAQDDDKDDVFKFILYYLFIQNLEKAFILGLPKLYTNISNHDSTLKGRIDTANYIKKDIPFKGKISSISKEQKYDQNIIDTLYKATSIVNKNMPSFTSGMLDIFTNLKENRSKNYLTKDRINDTIRSKALKNPMFLPYKQTLIYAKNIIESNSLNSNDSGDKDSLGFIMNIAELFEIYILKLLKRNFTEWSVESPKIKLYENAFYHRKIIPDIVMKKDDKILVFDTKYKTMNMQKRGENGLGDVDREDFFQINTYMSYYQNRGFEVVAGGLLYPMAKFELDKCHSDNWLGNSKTKFIIDGIDISCEKRAKF